MTKYNDCTWKDLPEDAKKAAKVLGYKKKTWDEDLEVAVDDKEWDELTDEQQEAAKVLGYTEESWNADDSDSEGCCGCF
ncbi:hypothetical protein FisN_5Lh152 [Fistulifera solaris]|uniref:Uncharacterized protein n=1 Tax=Fistulifera solaris TaxID=1519565 RepID=A0A1Z5JJJ1_FISSO|nr:hypothetical protein FisN_5Lh152 [Fistulifera solaris]|eukprot:GAX13941.1 hypothetical protein FisN_5Lh152 [Fistulifera solaris]